MSITDESALLEMTAVKEKEEASFSPSKTKRLKVQFYISVDFTDQLRNPENFANTDCK